MRGEAGYPLRLRFAKQGKVRFVSHRDVARAFERSLRIAAAPVAFTQGFSPRPKMSFGLALAVGHESRAEYLDLELRDPAHLDGLVDALDAGLPEGLSVTGAATLSARAPALQESVSAVAYQLRPAGLSAETLAAAAAALRDAASVSVETTRKGHPLTVDVRPSLRYLEVEPSTSTLTVEISTRPRAARAGEILAALYHLAGVEPGEGEDRVLRTHQWIERDGARREPLAADRATPAPAGTGPRALEAYA